MKDLLVVLGGEVASGRAVAKKIRAEHYCCTLLPSHADVTEVKKHAPAGIIIAGESEEGAAAPSAALLEIGIPVLALGSAAHVMLSHLGALESENAVKKEVIPVEYMQTPLFEDVSAGERFFEFAASYRLPERFQIIANSEGHAVAYGNMEANHYFLQFQMERNDPDGMAILLSFTSTICGCTPWWTVETIIAGVEKNLRQSVNNRQVICAISGGLDSTVAAVLAKRALGNQILCLFVDTGLMRNGESALISSHLRDELALPFFCIDASRRVINALSGVALLEEKRKIVENEIFRALLEKSEQNHEETVFIKGTHYLDKLHEKKRAGDPSSNPAIFPLIDLFKDEIRKIGEYLQLPPEVLNRQPFPGMGLAARIHGAVNEERLQILRCSDAVFESELKKAGLHKRLKRYFTMLHAIDGQYVIVLRATQGSEPKMSAARLPSDVLERTVERLQAEVPGIRHVLYDITPGIAEWSQ